MVKETRKCWLRKENSVHMLCPFLATPLSGMLDASWHRQVGINPPQGSPFGAAFSHYEASQNRKAGLNARFVVNSMSLWCYFHRRAHGRVSKVQQKMCSLREQITKAPSILTLSWRILDEPPRWKVVVQSREYTWILGPGEEFNPGPETRLNRSELLCNKVLLKYKGDRESFWHRHQKGAERVPAC